jgi:uncharacterized protein (TIGR04255 family)
VPDSAYICEPEDAHLEPSRILVTFDHPPVAEVICGVQFLKPQRLSVAHLGTFCSELEGFVGPKDELPIASILELPQLKISQSESPVRIMLTSATGTEIVQLQLDRFHCNWQRTDRGNAYPRYDAIIEKFLARLARYESFIERTCGSKIQLTQCELTYINHIPQGSGWNSLRDLGHVFRDFCWHSENRKVLPEPEGLDYQSTFLLPDGAGRMRVRLQTATLAQQGVPVLVLELTTRGILDQRVAWFDLAHKWIVEGFQDLTTPEIQTAVWRKNGSTS